MKFKKELEVIATLERTLIKPNEETDLHCLFQVRTQKSDVKKRKPIELACVLDVSGSMQIEDKLKWSKRSIRKIIKHLTPLDKLHFIIYDIHARVVFENGDLGDKEKLINEVRSVQIGTSTNIGAGLGAAYEILQKNKDESSTKRIFLFSDGHANEGIQTDEGLFGLIRKYREDGISTSSFGIGTDFNSSLMTGMATVGGGRYFFLANKSSITKQVSKAIHGLLDQIGTNGSITVRGMNDCQVEEIPLPQSPTTSPNFEDDGEQDDEDDEKDEEPRTNMTNETNFEVGDLFSENCKNVLVKFRIPSHEAQDEEFTICEFELQYESRVQGIVKTMGTVSLKIQSVENYSHYESTLVKISMKVKQAAQRNERIAQLLSENKMNEAISEMNDFIRDLETFVDRDETGKMKRLVEKAKIDLGKMRMHTDIQEVQQRRRYSSYQCQEDEDGDMLVSPCDSDEGNWTPSPTTGQGPHDPFNFDGFGDDQELLTPDIDDDDDGDVVFKSVDVDDDDDDSDGGD